IKIEPPQGDITRTWKNKEEFPGSNQSSYYASINYGKEVLSLDLNKPSDRNQLNELLSEADVLLENFRSSTLKKFDLLPKKTLQLNPKLIHAHLSGFENDDQRLAYDVVIQAESGFMSINGEKGGNPLKMPVALMDVLAAHQLKEAVLAALFHREKTGQGGYISCSLEMSGIASLVNQSSKYLNTGRIPESIGSLHPNIAPYGDTFKCQDHKFIVTAIGSDRQFADLLQILELDELIGDGRFNSNPSRLQNREALQSHLSLGFSRFESALIMSKAKENKVPLALVKNIGEVMDQEQVQPFILADEQDGVQLNRMASKVFRYSSDGS
ncbi:MAG: CoA transferase, partial [Bacteroidota bacterium]